MNTRITTHPHKELFEKTRDIPKDQIHSDTYSSIGSSMLDILRKKGGIGLSANQVGLPLNMCVIELRSTDPKIMLNPRIVNKSKETMPSKEGCLSLPGAVVTVSRYKEVTVEYEDVVGKTESIEATGLLSACLQHEIDHLSGILMINRVSEVERSRAVKDMNTYKRRAKRQ